MKISREQIDKYEYIDFHTHMHDKAFDIDGTEVMQNIIDKKIICVTIGTDYEESKKAMELSYKYENVFYTIGVHPHDNLAADFDKSEFEKLITDKCLAIGECGLDYYYDDTIDEKNRQERIFRKQIDFALIHNLPLMIHGRPKADNDAYTDIIKILSEYKSIYGDKLRGNFHFFVGSKDIAEQCMSLGFTFSFGGALTLTHDYDELVSSLPTEYIHAETDSPYVTPRDSGGKKIILNPNCKSRNTSENIIRVVERIAELKGVEVEDLKNKLKENFLTFVNR